MMDIRVVRIRITKLSVKITEHGFQREKTRLLQGDLC